MSPLTRSILAALVLVAPVLGGCSSAYTNGAASSPPRELRSASACQLPSDGLPRDGYCQRSEAAPREVAARESLRSASVADEEGGGRAAAPVVSERSASQMHVAHHRR